MAEVIMLLLVIGVFALVGVIAWRGIRTSLNKNAVTVYDYEIGVKYTDGKIVELVQPGFHRKKDERTIIERIDMRENSLTVAGQEVLTKDNMPVRVTALVRWKVSDALVYKRATANPSTRLYETVQVFLRKRIGGADLDAILTDRTAIDRDAQSELAAELAGTGVEVIAFDLRDVTLVGVAKQAYADLWRAQKEGLAALERARGEQAALRSLANAARMLKGNPELMNLRVLQALQGQQGKASPTVILGGAPGLVPVSKDAAPDAPSE